MSLQNNGQIEPSQSPPELEGWGLQPLIWAEVGSAIMFAAWVIQQLVRLIQAKAEKDGLLLESSNRQQAEQAARLIEMLANDQERMHSALTELRESIDALTNLVGRSPSLNPSSSNPYDDPAIPLPSETGRRSD